MSKNQKCKYGRSRLRSYKNSRCSCSVPCDGFFVKGKCKIRVIAPRPNKVSLHLGALNTTLNFDLLRLKGCPVKVQFECAKDVKEVEGTVCEVGTDFIEVLPTDKKSIITILKERVVSIEWLDPTWNPLFMAHS